MPRKTARTAFCRPEFCFWLSFFLRKSSPWALFWRRQLAKSSCSCWRAQLCVRYMSKRLARLARLATREDVLAVCGSWSLPHVHKTLALLVVWHTLHRLVLGMGGAATLPLVAALTVHLLLSLSAVVFTVPVHTKMPHVLDGLYRAQVAATSPLHQCTTAPVRHCTDMPTHQLYRAQVLAFTARSVGVMLLVLLEPPPEPACRLHTCLLLCRLAVVAASHRAADAAQRRTVRALRDATDPHPAASTGVRRALRTEP